MIDFAQRQRAAIASEQLQLIEDNVSQEAFTMGSHRRKWPIGARWYWALQEVWAPRGASVPERKEAAE